MANKCIFEYIGTGGATSYEVEVQPDIDIVFERIQEPHKLGSGLTKLYTRGYLFHCELTWGQKKLIQGAQMKELKDIYNATTGMTFYPYPESAPSASFEVGWFDRKLDFHLIEGVPDVGFSGSMNLTGTEILDLVPEEWIVE